MKRKKSHTWLEGAFVPDFGNWQSCTSSLLTRRNRTARWDFCVEQTCDYEMNRDKTRPCVVPRNWTGMQGGRASLARCWSTEWLWPGSWSRRGTVAELTSSSGGSLWTLLLLDDGALGTGRGPSRGSLSAAAEGPGDVSQVVWRLFLPFFESFCPQSSPLTCALGGAVKVSYSCHALIISVFFMSMLGNHPKVKVKGLIYDQSRRGSGGDCCSVSLAAPCLPFVCLESFFYQ